MPTIGRPRRRSVEDQKRRFESLILKTATCWIWMGKLKQGSGYGKFPVWNEETGVWDNNSAHRASYEFYIGPIPEGMTLDHTCHTKNRHICPGGPECLHRRCVNPYHLEPVTMQINLKRGNTTGNRTHCAQGHPYSKENTRITKVGRQCKICCRAAVRKNRIKSIIKNILSREQPE